MSQKFIELYCEPYREVFERRLKMFEVEDARWIQYRTVFAEENQNEFVSLVFNSSQDFVTGFTIQVRTGGRTALELTGLFLHLSGNVATYFRDVKYNLIGQEYRV